MFFDGDAPSVPGANGELVRIDRSGAAPTHWRIYRREIPGEHDLAGEIAVGLRYVPGEGDAALVPAVDGIVSAPFHLFFPTRIPSGLPFLLHGYFQVDASRKGFHGAAEPNNQRILTALAELVRDIVRCASKDSGLDSASLVNLLAACPEPEDSLARAFQGRVLGLLDEEEWIPALTMDGGRRHARPQAFFVDSPRLTRMIADVFPAWYVSERTGLALGPPQLDDAAIDLIAKRQEGARRLWDVLGQLFRPGELDVWSPSDADAKFRKLIALVSWLIAEFPNEAEVFLTTVQGDGTSRLLPVVSDSGGRNLLPLPDPAGGSAGKRSQLVMARVRASAGGDLVPPPELEVSFLPEGLLENEQELGQARPLGIRPYTVDNVLDRLNGIGEAPEHAADVLSFMWKLLARERRNQYGTKKVAERSAVFNPADWFWCRPGRARESGSRRLEQQRERYLSGVLLPARNGRWRAAGELAFGADWADWIDTHRDSWSTSAVQSRATAYRALEAVCPDPGNRLLASPKDVLGKLDKIDIRMFVPADTAENSDPEGTEDEPEEALDDAGWDRERHAFLLRLGVWEVLPLEALEGRDVRGGRDPFPWEGKVADLQRELCTRHGGWTFGLNGWRGKKHTKVFLGEDYRFQWNLGAAAAKSPHDTALLLRLGTSLYETRLHAMVFCPGCTDNDANSWHSAPRQSSSTDDYPSWLAIELQTEPWVPVRQAGEAMTEPAEPKRSWWLEKPPTGQGMTTSPWRFVPTCAPSTGVTEDLQRIAHVTTLEDAGAPELQALLHEMRRRFDAHEIDLTKSTDRRSFVSLHTMIYERLAELPAEEGKDVVEQTGVLCTVGSSLIFSTRAAAMHDDGTFSSYVRYFVDRVPLAVIARDRTRVSDRLGIGKLIINLGRDSEDEGVDVTDELTGMLAARLPELLAILVHHSLGSQTLTLDSEEFRDRAQRFKRLIVRKVEDLVIHASIAGIDHVVRLGARTTGELFLEPSTTSRPAVLFHDFDGENWQDRLRRKIAPHIAAVLRANPYAHTFALFLQAESDDEREEFLLELGISDEDLGSVATQLGVVSAAEQASYGRWYTALLQTLGHNTQPDRLDPDSLEKALRGSGLSTEVVRLLMLSGGGDDVRSDTQPRSVLRVLHASGLDLEKLDTALRALSPDDGLKISETRRAFQDWKRQHERRVVAVRARVVTADQAKSEVRELAAPSELALALDAPLAEVLAGVADLLASNRDDVAELLAADPISTLTRLGGFATPEELDAAAAQMYDIEERQRALSTRAARWRNRIQRLAVLIRMTATETRSGVRAHDAAVREILSFDLRKPSDLIGAVDELFSAHPSLREQLLTKLEDSVLGPEPDDVEILGWAHAAGIDDVRIVKYDIALSEPRNRRAAQLKARAGRLAEARMTAMVPAGLIAPKPPRQHAGTTSKTDGLTSPIKVSKIKVSSTFDQRKRELGDEGEQWALADVVGTFLAMNDHDRAQAVDEVRELLGLFEPEATRGLLEHASSAAAPREDEEDDDLVAAIEGLLHVSRQSDGFGFDLIGWAAPDPDSPPQAMCVEVKSTSSGSFHLSTNEWNIAQELVAKAAANRYAVLAVRRGKAGEVPTSMDLLVNPIGLHDAGLLTLDTDGYIAKYSPLT